MPSIATYASPGSRIPFLQGVRGTQVRPVLDSKGNCTGYRSLIAHGGTGRAALGIGAAGTLSWSIEENAPALRFVVQADAGPEDITVTSIKVDNDELVTGSVPFQLFEKDSVYNPMVGKWFTTASKVTASFQNDGAAATNIAACFTA